MSASCNTCKKTEPQVQLKRCAKCSTTQYCSRDCQKSDWKAHKKICGKQAAEAAAAAATAPSPARASRPGSGPNSGPSSSKGLDQPVPDPFTRLDNGTYLHGRPEADVYRLLIDAYRLHVEDSYVHDGDVDEDSLYAGAPDGLAGFRRFLREVAAHPRLLPSWWTAEKQQECEEVGMKAGEWSDLRCAVEKQDIIDHYGDSRFPMQLRMFNEAVYGRAPGGSDGTAMRKMMAAMEGGGAGGPFAGMNMEMMDVAGLGARTG
ncbi:hypothetical protein ACJ41O_010041 [Fusarium nematophilum]